MQVIYIEKLTSTDKQRGYISMNIASL